MDLEAGQAEVRRQAGSASQERALRRRLAMAALAHASGRAWSPDVAKACGRLPQPAKIAPWDALGHGCARRIRQAMQELTSQ